MSGIIADKAKSFGITSFYLLLLCPVRIHSPNTCFWMFSWKSLKSKLCQFICVVNCRLILFSRWLFCWYLLSGLQCSYYVLSVLDNVTPDLSASVPAGCEAVPGSSEASLPTPTPQPPSEATDFRRPGATDLFWRPRDLRNADGLWNSDIYHKSLGARYTLDPCERERAL